MGFVVKTNTNLVFSNIPKNFHIRIKESKFTDTLKQSKMTDKLGQEPAFPTDRVNSQQGMSKRYLTAKDLMCAMLGNMPFIEANAKTAKQQLIKPDEFLIFTAYSLADELLKQESNE